MKEAILKNEAYQKEFDENGFVKIKLFTSSEIEDLNKLRDTYFPGDPNAFFSSSYLNELEQKKEVSNAISNKISNAIERELTNHRLIGGAFLIKGTGPKSEMPMHQDWTIVDEQQFYAANMWIPLTETNQENGTLELLKGSHLWNEAIRAPTLPMAFEGHQELIKPHLTSVEMELGEVILLNQATIHYSKPNLSGKVRPAITAGIISKDATLKFFYYNTEREEIEEFAQDDDFLLRIENFHEAIYKRPKIGLSVGHFDYTIPYFSENELKERLGIYENVKPQKRSLFQRIFGS